MPGCFVWTWSRDKGCSLSLLSIPHAPLWLMLNVCCAVVTSGYDKRWEFTCVNKLVSNVIEYALASGNIINNIFDFKIRVEIISTHITLLLKL